MRIYFRKLVLAIIIIVSMGLCVGATPPSSSTTQQKNIRQRRDQLKNEIERLQHANPSFFINRQSDKLVEVFSPIGTEAYLLLLAAKLCEYELDTLQREFPMLCYIYQPIFLGDLDDDGEIEVLTDRSSVHEDFTELVIFQQEGETFGEYAKVIHRRPLKISVRTVSDDLHQIVATAQESRPLPIMGRDTHKTVTLVTIKQMLLQFTGNEIKEISPFKVVYEGIKFDE